LRQEVDDKGDELKYELVKSIATSDSQVIDEVDEELGGEREEEPARQFEEIASQIVSVEEEAKSEEAFNPLLQNELQQLRAPNNTPCTTRTNTIDSQDDFACKLTPSIESDLFFSLELNTDFSSEQEVSTRTTTTTHSTNSGPPVVYSSKCSGLNCTRM